MKILLTDMVGKSEQFSCSETFESPLLGFKLKEPVTASLLVRQQSEEKYLLSGELRATVNAGCDRCGKAISLLVDRHFRYVIRIGDESESDSEYQYSDEDCETLYLNKAAIDSEAIIAEQLLLAVPVQRLCDKSCKGLCRECGSNLNEKKCKCGAFNSNSPFAILKTLQQK